MRRQTSTSSAIGKTLQYPSNRKPSTHSPPSTYAQIIQKLLTHSRNILLTATIHQLSPSLFYLTIPPRLFFFKTHISLRHECRVSHVLDVPHVESFKLG